jgi:predicted PurR-regulated permease PerM
MSGHVFRKTLVQTLTILTLVLLALLIGTTVYILLLFFAGILFSVLVNFFAHQIMRLRFVPHWLAVTIVLIVLAALLAILVVTMVPMISQEMEALVQQLNKALKELVQWLNRTAGGPVPRRPALRLERPGNGRR